jgi:outer-membrane receptor for ferric coprogen and ferric-rhodotorulic acid
VSPHCLRAAAGDELAKLTLKIAAQPLGGALQELARQSGVQIVFFSRITEGLQAKGLDGEYVLTAALEKLLAGSNLTFHVINPKTIEIQPGPRAAANRSAAPTRGENSQPRSSPATPAEQPAPVAEVLVTATAEELVATRTATPLREIPQTMSIISREQMDQQNDTDLGDALANAIGITAVRSDSLSQSYYSRGFQVQSYHLDGGAALNAFETLGAPFSTTPDLGEFDHIEVLRGADALFGGNGDPGASVSLVRKRPLDTTQVAFNASVGSWNNYRVEGDLTGPLGLDGALRGRTDVVYEHRDYFFDTARLERKKVFAVLDYIPTATTTLTAGGSYEWSNAVPFEFGLPLYDNGSDPHLPRNTAFTTDWGRYRTRTRELYFKLQQRFAADWQLKVNATSLDVTAAYGFAVFSSAIDPLTRELEQTPAAAFTGHPNTQNQFALDAILTGTLDWFGRREEVAIGGDWTHYSENLDIPISYLGGPPVNAHAFDAAAYPESLVTAPPLTNLRLLAGSNQAGLFGSFKVHFNPDWSLVAGARVSGDDSKTVTPPPFPGQETTTTKAKYNGKITPYVGVMYQLDRNYSLYASYSDIYLSNAGDRGPDGKFLSPADGIDMEVGIKGAWRDGQLNGSVVLFDIDQRGVAENDPDVTPLRQVYGDCCYLPSGANHSKGIDTEISGRPAPGWLIGAGYTFDINRTESGGDLSTVTPRHLVKVWTSSNLPGTWRRWTVGGSLHAQSPNFYAGESCSQPTGQLTCTVVNFRDIQQFYAVVDLRLSYELNPHWRAALSVNNVFDRVYYETIGSPGNGNWYGEPRNVLLRIDGKL